MSELAKNCIITGDPFKKLWINRLPPSLRAVLAVSGDTRLEDLAAIANKILENLRTCEVAAVSSSSTSEANLEIIGQLRQLTQELTKIVQKLWTAKQVPRLVGFARQRQIDTTAYTKRQGLVMSEPLEV
jgi:hypothetical protein